MKRTLAALAAAAGLFAAGILALAAPGPVLASTGEPSWNSCSKLESWYANPDEQDRKPTPTVMGLKFEGDDLIHHASSGVTVDTLTPGSYVAVPGPDQPSFFSVEVRNADGSGYATLRWNQGTGKWNMVTGGQFYENESPAALVKMPPVAKGKNVFSFGVGYTKNPPGTVATVVRTVTFNGTVYDLSCPQPTRAPKPVDDGTIPPGHPVPTSPSATVSPSASTTSPTSSPSTSVPPVQTSPPDDEVTVSAEPSQSTGVPIILTGGNGSLPQTGPRTDLIIAGGVLLVGIGTLVTVALRRRKVTFNS